MIPKTKRISQAGMLDNMCDKDALSVINNTCKRQRNEIRWFGMVWELQTEVQMVTQMQIFPYKPTSKSMQVFLLTVSE